MVFSPSSILSFFFSHYFIMDISENLCKICSIEPFKYVCPRCNIPYCSVICYRAVSHSNCSEAFYKECIQEHIKSEQPVPESRQRMIDILERVREDDENGYDFSSGDEDSDDCESINERLKDCNLDDADSIWERLTDEERGEFLNFIKDGDATKVLPMWEPWWSKKYPKKRVRFVGESDTPSYVQVCPPVLKTIPALTQITKVKPSDFVFNNLVNVLGGYVVMTRYFNGEHSTMPKEATTILLSISKNISGNQNYTSFNIALESVMQEAINSEYITTSENMRHSMKDDVMKLLQGPNDEEYTYYIQAALADVHSVLKDSKKYNSNNSSSKGKFYLMFPHNNINTCEFSKDLVNKCIYKIQYYQSWCTEHYLPTKLL